MCMSTDVFCTFKSQLKAKYRKKNVAKILEWITQTIVLTEGSNVIVLVDILNIMFYTFSVTVF